MAQLLDFVDAELLGNCNFEFLQVAAYSAACPTTALRCTMLHSERAVSQPHCLTATSRELVDASAGRSVNSSVRVSEPSCAMRPQAFLRAVLQIHGEAILEHEQLQQRAAQIEQHLRKSWSRIEALVEQTRCMVGLLNNQQI